MEEAFMDVSAFFKQYSFLTSHVLVHRFVTLFWPKKVKATKLEEIHAKMVMKEAADPNLKKPRPNASVGAKTNGTSSVSASTSIKNGKSYR